MLGADLNTQAYKLIFEIEIALREFLISKCEPTIGPKWYIEVLAQAQAAKLARLVEPRLGLSPADLRAKDDKKGWASRLAFHPIYFVDFPELGAAFKMKRNSELGRFTVGGSAPAIADHVDRLVPIRNAVAHNRPIVQADLSLVKSIHAQTRAELGASAFDQYIACPSVNATAEERAKLLGELLVTSEEARHGREVRLVWWPKLKQRWWLEPEWQLDAKSVAEAFALLERYQDHWTEEVVGRRRRMEMWMSNCWQEDTVQRARASLDRDSVLSERQDHE